MICFGFMMNGLLVYGLGIQGLIRVSGPDKDTI
ncbi:MAG: hypothetical protein ACJAYC_003130 [Halieaceae bacterium]|jgi:hypothetical protein